MQKLKTFFRSFIKSITSPAYYADVVKAKFSFALKYFTLFHFFFATGVTLFLVGALSLINFSTLADQALINLPKDLTVHVENGKLKINKPLPYVVPVPISWEAESEMDRSQSEIKDLVVFDSDKNVTSIADFYKYQTAALVTESFIYYRGNSDSNEVRVMPIPEDKEPFTVSSYDVLQAKQKLFEMPFVKNKIYLAVAAAFLLLFITPILTLVHFITALFYSLIMYFIARFGKNVFFKGRIFTYTQILQVSLFTLIPLILLQMIFSQLDMQGLHGMRFFIVYVIGTSIALWGAAKGTDRVKPVSKKKVAKKK